MDDALMQAAALASERATIRTERLRTFLVPMPPHGDVRVTLPERLPVAAWDTIAAMVRLYCCRAEAGADSSHEFGAAP